MVSSMQTPQYPQPQQIIPPDPPITGWFLSFLSLLPSHRITSLPLSICSSVSPTRLGISGRQRPLKSSPTLPQCWSMWPENEPLCNFRPLSHLFGKFKKISPATRSWTSYVMLYSPGRTPSLFFSFLYTNTINCPDSINKYLMGQIWWPSKSRLSVPLPNILSQVWPLTPEVFLFLLWVVSSCSLFPAWWSRDSNFSGIIRQNLEGVLSFTQV